VNPGIALLALLLQTSPAPPAVKATIEGNVVRAGSSEPVAGVHVTLARPPEPRPATPVAQTRPPAVAPSATTDAQGKFVFKDVDAGSYRLAVAADGYVRQEYGQKIFPGQGTPLNITAGQEMKGLVVPMTRAANIGGHVIDSGKQPVAAIPVHLMRLTYDVNGRRNVQPAASTQTDDRGEYRLYYQTPGRYYLSAGMLPEAQPARAFNGIMETYAMTYYPGTADVSQATIIDIKPGAELNMDVAMTQQARYHIRGRIVDSRTNQVPSSVILSLTPRGASSGAPYEITSGMMTYSSTDGTYEVRDVLPGTYLLTGTWGDSISISNSQMAAFGLAPQNPQQPRDPEAQRAQAQSTTGAFAVIREGVAYASVSIGTSDIENIVLTIMPGGSVSGRVRIENPPAGSSPRVQLKTSLDGLPANIPGVFAPRAMAINADGSFSIPNVRVGEYRVSVEELPRGYYVKEARVGASDVLNRPFQFSPADNASLEFVVGPGATSISGTVSNERREPVPGALAVLVPERQRDRIDLYKSESADARGQFEFSNVAPGDYKVFAWEALEPNAYFNPDVVKQEDARSKILHVQENSPQTIEVRAIPPSAPF
jgi:Carboxypeptidase regulatory-like domain